MVLLRGAGAGRRASGGGGGGARAPKDAAGDEREGAERLRPRRRVGGGGKRAPWGLAQVWPSSPCGDVIQDAF